MRGRMHEGRDEGRDILQQTIEHFQLVHPTGSFEDFLMLMWPDDFRLYARAQAGDGSTGRSYSSWRALFDAHTHTLALTLKAKAKDTTKAGAGAKVGAGVTGGQA